MKESRLAQALEGWVPKQELALRLAAQKDPKTEADWESLRVLVTVVQAMGAAQSVDSRKAQEAEAPQRVVRSQRDLVGALSSRFPEPRDLKIEQKTTDQKIKISF